MLSNPSQIEFTDHLPEEEAHQDGRVRSRFNHKKDISYLKTMYLLNIGFVALWTILSCIFIIYPGMIGVQSINLPLYVFVGTIYLSFFLVMFSLKFGKLNLLKIIRIMYRGFCGIAVTILVLTVHYIDIRRQFPLLVIVFSYLYQLFLTRLRDKWPEMQELRWHEYMDPISKFESR